MGEADGGLKNVWVAIVLLSAMVCGVVAALVFWVAGHDGQMGGRIKGALTAGGATFLGTATLGLTVGIFLSS
ncbi:hypothetical protein ACFWHW_30160 [Streptomyces pharetrae]|uniref:hypothetical protein n=1 Tax=Streptomyces pharetrae TaxID=291370 RepID=UPI003652E018